MVRFDQCRNHRDHLFDVFRCLGFLGWSEISETVICVAEGGSRFEGNVLCGRAQFNGPIDDLVINVGDVADELNVITGPHHVSVEDVEYDRRSAMPEMRLRLHCWAAEVNRHATRVRRNERNGRALKRVVQLHLGHGNWRQRTTHPPVTLASMITSPLGPGTLVYAHRGDRSRAADNTIEAYTLAIEAGADGIELDVRRTRDGVLVVSHDDRYQDLGTIVSLDFNVLRDLAPAVPTLREAMDSIPRHIFVNVEIKNFPIEDGFDEERMIVDETLDELRLYDDPKRILMSSFDPGSMQRALTAGPEFLRSQLVLMGVPLDTGLAVAQEFEMNAINPNLSHMVDDTASVMTDMRDAHLGVVVWGVNTPEDVAQMARAGVNVIITDDPGMARTVIDQL
jgi:glycerophosphoryl diester phosphodiesterase